MSPSLDRLRGNKRLMAYTAAAMYGGAAFDGSIEGFLPGDPSFAVVPVLASISVAALLVAFGPLLPRWALASMAPIGVVLIAYALTATIGAGDGAVLYIWPVLWMTFFFGRRGAISIVALVGAAHAVTLLLLPPSSSYPGRWVDVMVSVSVVAWVVLTLVRHNDILLSRLADEARTDVLTGLLNRRGFDERAVLELAHARRERRSLALITIDVDHFKRINDEWGHEVGDQVLVRIGRHIASEARDIDVAARFGGEEFVVLLSGCESEDAVAFAERIRTTMARQDSSGLPSANVSAGVFALSSPPSIETMLHHADSALYEAKRAGRNRTLAFRASRSRAEVDAGSTATPAGVHASAS